MVKTGLKYAIASVLTVSILCGFLDADVSLGISSSARVRKFDGRTENFSYQLTCRIVDGRLKFSNKMLCRDIIILADMRAVILVDHNLKNYSEITYKQIADAKNRTVEKLRRSLERIAGSGSALETETRDLLGRLEPSEDADSIPSVKELSDGGKTGDIQSRRYRVEYGGAVFEVWLASDGKYGGLEAERNTLYGFYEEFGIIRGKVAAELGKLEGFPVRIECNSSFWLEGLSWQKDVGRTETITVDGTDKMDEKAFAAPEGYVKVEYTGLSVLQDAPVTVPPGGVSEESETEEEFE